MAEADDSGKPHIEERENGPLVVKNVGKMVSEDGTDLGARPAMALCRCGASKNKPFCDGSHMGTGFSSAHEDTSHRDRLFHYEGENITIHYNRVLCSHAGECGAKLKEVFDPGRDPWIEPDRASVDQVKEVVKACPSGALSISEKGGDLCHLYDEESIIIIEKDGPYHIRNVELEGAEWASQACRQKYVLCRCGASKNKPFCDGAHVDIGWRDDAE